MTKIEAIQVLKDSIDNGIERTEREWEEFDKLLFKAVEMAINALENLQQPCNNLATNLQVDTPTNTPTDLISRQAAISIPVMPKEHRNYRTYNLDDAYDDGWHDALAYVSELPSAQPVTTNEITIYEDGTLWVTVEDCEEVDRVIVDEYGEKFCRTFYMDAEPPEPYKGVTE